MGHSQQQTEKAAEGTSGTRCGRTEIPIIPRSAGIAANIHVYDVLHVYIYIYTFHGNRFTNGRQDCNML